MKGIIIRAISSFYYVEIGSSVYECKARGIFKHRSEQLYVGDWVEIEVLDEENKKANIVAVLPRRNKLKRPPIANVTQAILVFSLKKPAPNLSLIDRFLVLAQKEELSIVIVLNKADLDTQNVASSIVEAYRPLGYPVLVVSAMNEENIQQLRPYLDRQTTIVAGPSGAGKSTLINALIRTQLKTGRVSEKIGRGRHTTRYVELIAVDSESYIADSPGFSAIDLNEMDEYDLRESFVEFHEYDVDCKFGAKCLHENEPSCQVKEAVEEQKISTIRYKSYIQLLNEIRENKRRTY